MSLVSKYRSHTCNELRSNHIGQEVRLSGWVANQRDHGGITFLDLRDHYGITQIVISEKLLTSDVMKQLSNETVIYISGKVVKRGNENVNSDLPTGEIEVVANDMSILSKAKPLPYQINKDQHISDALRLKYRFLDLRRESLHRNIMLRSNVCKEVRKYMTSVGFNEITTPILTSSSPEGARDFLVPSRLHPGKFYALPQAPQQFKQLLMVANFDRYFQIAPCFRDEDARADRSPGEFYQIDMELSFVEQQDVFKVTEGLFDHIFSTFSKIPYNRPPFPQFSFKDSMLRFGNDKPDLRIPQEIVDVTDLFSNGPVDKLKDVIAQGGVVRMLACPGIANESRSVFDGVQDFIKAQGAFGMMWVNFMEDGTFKGTLSKFVNESFAQNLQKATKTKKGDTLFMVAGNPSIVAKSLGNLRIKIADDFNLREKDVFKFCWIRDYPMYEKDDAGQIQFSHNPFSMPQGGMNALEDKDPLDILAYQYDIVCNGIELSSGAIRNHSPEVMYKAFSIAGHTKEDVDDQFSGMINAFQYGAPPHGGIAPGLDRIVMLLADEPNIREVTAFPMNNQAEDLLMGAPSFVKEKQLRELHIKLNLPKKEVK